MDDRIGTGEALIGNDPRPGFVSVMALQTFDDGGQETVTPARSAAYFETADRQP